MDDPRVGVVYTKRDFTKYAWVAQAFRNLGCRVLEACSANSHEQLRSVERLDGLCELLVFEQWSAGCNATDLASLAAKRQAKWCQWWFDLIVTDPLLPLDEQGLVRTFDRILPCFDRVFVKERSWMSAYRSIGISAAYLDQGCPSHIPPVDVRESPRFDVFYAGTLDAQRYQMLAKLAKTLKVMHCGHSSPHGIPQGVTSFQWRHPIKLYELASNCAVGLVDSMRLDVDGYWSDRLWLYLGMGMPSVVLRSDDGLPNYPDLRGIATVCKRDDLLGFLEFFSAPSGIAPRLAMSRASRRLALLSHSYEARCEEVLKCFGLESPINARTAVAQGSLSAPAKSA